MDPERFLRGTMRLDPEQAHNVFKTRIADPLGLSVTEAGFGIFRIAAAKITDLIRQITVEQGLDPRDFVLHAFGGSCGMIAGSFGKELSVQRIVVPNTASVNCAFGLVSADIVHEYVATQTHVLPVDVSDINAIFAPMMNTARNALKSEGFEEQQTEYNWSVAFRYSRQVHEIITPVRSDIPLTEQSLTVLVDDFEKLYESRYGKGSAFREAGIEMTQFRVTARGLMDKPQLKEWHWNGSDPSAAWLGCVCSLPFLLLSMDKSPELCL